MASPVIDELEVTKKLIAWGERAAKQGLDLSVDLQPSIDKPQQMQRLVHYVRSGCPLLGGTGIAYDAKTVCGVLGLPEDCDEEAPKAADGEVVVWYGGWALGELVDKVKVSYLLDTRNTWRKYQTGYYRVLMPVPQSNELMWSDQAGDARNGLLARLYSGWKVVPTPIAATALVVHLSVTGGDLLKGNFCRCAEELPLGRHVELGVLEGRVNVRAGWVDDHYSCVFIGTARRV